MNNSQQNPFRRVRSRRNTEDTEGTQFLWCVHSYIIQTSNTAIYPSLFSAFLLMRYIEIRFCICQFMPHIHSLIWNLTLIFSAFPVGVAQPCDFLSTDLIRWGISFGPLGTVNGVISLNDEIFSKTKDTVRTFPLLL